MEGKTLYLGLHPPKEGEDFVHFPVIQVEHFSVDHPFIFTMMMNWGEYTHLVFTSRSAVKGLNWCCEYYGHEKSGKVGISVGKATAKEMERCGFSVDYVAEREQAEGIIEWLDRLDLKKAFVLWPHSTQSRSLLSDYFVSKEIRTADVTLYDTVAVDVSNRELPDLDQFEKIIFTSPSTVDAFLKIYGSLDVNAELVAIGPITHDRLYSVTMDYE